MAYHDIKCQRSHWKSKHKNECKDLQRALRPLDDLLHWNKLFRESQSKYHSEGIGVECGSGAERILSWWEAQDWNGINENVPIASNNLWNESVRKWNGQDYLNAMQGFQEALEPYFNAWNALIGGTRTRTTNHKRQGESSEHIDKSIVLAKRLLFCAYCEIDGNEVGFARGRLVQCLSILLTLSSSNANLENSIKAVMDDAWMELMLSMEEIPQHRLISRHVSKLAISTNSCCWKDPLQRPGYMAPIPLKTLSFIPPEHHPTWCQKLEQNWEKILYEYRALSRHNSHSWLDVGSGERGSGHDDHRVVSGQSWKEYILFGTGAKKENDNDAPFTKQFLRNHVPDAISLAEQGGGEVIFSRLAPKSYIGAHCGPTNLRWTAHLGLVIPVSSSDCQIRVGMNWYSWQPGKMLLFDDSFEHEVRNDTDQERVVLLMRVWHPKLSCSKEARENLQREQFLMEAISKKGDAVKKRYHPPK